MSFISLVGIKDVKELPHAAEGRYSLVVTEAKLVDGNKEGTQNIRCILEIEGEERYQNIFHYIALPDGSDAVKDQNKLLMAKRFFTQFKVDVDDGVEVESIPGSRAECNLGTDEFQGQTKNVLKLDRMAMEG